MKNTIADQLQRELAAILEKNSFKKLLLGISGGPDSVFLLRTVAGMDQDLFERLQIAHINHCLRGEEADRDQAFVQELASELGIPCYVEKLDVKALAEKEKMGIEEAARKARYEYFARLVRKFKLDTVILAHTQNDQAETVLMNFVRGTGIKGLAGMQTIEERPVGKTMLRIVRPMLGLQKQLVLDHLVESKWAYRIDETNQDTNYTRNKLRHEVIPILLEINPNFYETVSRNGSLFDSLDRMYTELIDKGFVEINTIRERTELNFDLEQYRLFSQALRFGLIRKAYYELAGSSQELSFERVQAGDSLLMAEPGNKQVELGSLVTLYKKGKTFQMSKHD